MSELFKWITANKEWLFSGIATVLSISILGYLFQKWNRGIKNVNSFHRNHKASTNFMRYILPGLVLLGFFSWRYVGLWRNIYTSIGLLTASIIAGVIIYNFHRALFHPMVIFVERRVLSVPQYDFHQTIADELGAPQGALDIKVVQGCISEFISTVCTSEEKEESWSTNNAVHVLLMMSLLSLIALGHDAIFCAPAHASLFWLIPFVIFLAAGIATDYFWADEREVQLLRRYREKYKEILRRRVV